MLLVYKGIPCRQFLRRYLTNLNSFQTRPFCSFEF